MSNYKTHTVISKDDKMTFGKIEHAFRMKIVVSHDSSSIILSILGIEASFYH